MQIRRPASSLRKEGLFDGARREGIAADAGDELALHGLPGFDGAGYEGGLHFQHGVIDPYAAAFVSGRSGVKTLPGSKVLSMAAGSLKEISLKGMDFCL